MQSLKRRLSFRKKKDHHSESARVDQWEEDTVKVRNGTCSFQVRYLGYIEVFDSRGMHICEEAVKALKAQCKGKYQRAVLYVSGDALRVVDEVSKSMIVDQTIEKVSFCAPDRQIEKAFAYICRDGTTRRWMCHGFLAVKESVSGERLSHAVGCAFAICLEKKQKRGGPNNETTGVTVTYNQSRTSFERTGSFRQTTLTERICDPQSAILAEPVPVKNVSNPYAVQRPQASTNLLERQGSFRGFEKLNEISSPFKRTTSLRLNELPSTLQRQNATVESPTHNGHGAVASTINELPAEQEDSIAQMCQQLTEGLSALTSDDPFSNAPTQQRINAGPRGALTHQASLPTQNYPPRQGSAALLTRQHTSPASQTLQPLSQSINPWASAMASSATGVNTGVNQTSNSNPFMSGTAAGPPASSSFQLSSQVTNPTSNVQSGRLVLQPHQQQKPQNVFTSSGMHSNGSAVQPGSSAQFQQQTLQIRKPQLSTPQQNGASVASSSPWPTSAPAVPSRGPGVDPFDVAWAAKSGSPAAPNPFGGGNTVKKFEVQL